jgi:hypothetical protein
MHKKQRKMGIKVRLPNHRVKCQWMNRKQYPPKNTMENRFQCPCETFNQSRHLVSSFYPFPHTTFAVNVSQHLKTNLVEGLSVVDTDD